MPCGTTPSSSRCSSARRRDRDTRPRRGERVPNGSGEAGAAAAGARRVRIGDRETGLVEAVLVVERGAFEELGRGRVDDDLHGAVVSITGLIVAVEEHLVREPAAAAGTNGDAQRQLFGTFVGE